MASLAVARTARACGSRAGTRARPWGRAGRPGSRPRRGRRRPAASRGTPPDRRGRRPVPARERPRGDRLPRRPAHGGAAVDRVPGRDRVAQQEASAAAASGRGTAGVSIAAPFLTRAYVAFGTASSRLNGSGSGPRNASARSSAAAAGASPSRRDSASPTSPASERARIANVTGPGAAGSLASPALGTTVPWRVPSRSGASRRRSTQLWRPP